MLERLTRNLNNEKEHVVRLRILKQALNHSVVVQQCIEQLNSVKKVG